MLDEPHISEDALLSSLLETLRALPEVRAEFESTETGAAANGKDYDARISLQIGGKSFTLLIIAKKHIYPRDALQFIWQQRDFARSQPIALKTIEVLPLLAADSISPGAMELLRKEHIGYFDSAGSLFLPAEGAYLYIDKPPPKTLSKSILPLFTKRRAQVLHALLLRHQEWLSVKTLADLAMVSTATASQVLAELDRFDWVESRGQGPNKERHLTEPAKLLDTWVQQAASNHTPAIRRYYVPTLKPESLLDQIGKVFDAREVEYAISYEAAAQRYAPFLSNVSQVRCRLLVSKAAESAISELGARAVNDGANLLITEADSSGEFLFRENIGGIWLDSPIQVYIDLLHGEGRAKEMAEHLRKERMGF